MVDWPTLVQVFGYKVMMNLRQRERQDKVWDSGKLRQYTLTVILLSC